MIEGWDKSDIFQLSCLFEPSRVLLNFATVLVPEYTVVQNTAELQWLEYLWSHEKMFEIWEVRGNEC